jgi:hypothetical protein
VRRVGPLKLRPDEIERHVLRYEDPRMRWIARLTLSGVLPLPQPKRRRGRVRPKP